MKSEMTAVILSGGKNSRMNYKTKAFLDLDGKKFIECILDRLKGFKEICISCNDLSLYSEYKDRCRLILDEKKDIGPISGIYSALKTASTDKIFVLAADMPFVEEDIINSICSINSKEDILVASLNGGVDPLFAVYNKSVLNTLEKLISSNNYRLRGLLEECSTSYFYINSENCLRNINTVDEYISLKKDGLKKVPKIINIVASCSNSGKTTLIEGIIKELKKEECIISTIKHDVHGFDIDKKGKDTYRHRMAGADNISISSKNRFAMISELTDELNLEEILEKHKMSDYIIVEGYKNSSLKKIEVFRKGFSDKIITPLENLIAIATDDESLDSLAKKVDINDYKAIVEIINDSY
ncbi:molybdopterin-guanine dinucleotide biosynthesis protein B [uncultured Clostridium sp.]|uniref:molybdopterin-guanine dinucleotide biosynthesis protein B n=1 Tax=uncultured Clostridium sp. TaxID=59620 RepID=UPI00345BC6F3